MARPTGNDFYCREVFGARPVVEFIDRRPACAAFHHTRPQAEWHAVVAPVAHVPALADLRVDDSVFRPLMELVIDTVAWVEARAGEARVIANAGRLQDSPHVHWHVVAGEPLAARGSGTLVHPREI
jgi:histidine triad (HIT) family protein